MRIRNILRFIPEIVYGGNDGIITTFAIVASFVGAEAEQGAALGAGLVVLVFGLANLFGDAVSMGLGDYLSEKAEIDEVKNTTKQISQRTHLGEQTQIDSSREALKNKGLSNEDVDTILTIFRKNPDLWLDFVTSQELHLPNINSNKPLIKGMVTFTSFLTFGVIPLLPFVILGDTEFSRVVSFVATFLALFILGCVRWYSSGGNFFKKVFEIVLIGAIAAVVAYLVGVLFRV